jgi:hypothetical protein
MGHSKTSHVIGSNVAKNESLYQLDKTFTDIIESIQQQAFNSDNQI